MSMYEVLLLIAVAVCWTAALAHQSSALVSEFCREQSES